MFSRIYHLLGDHNLIGDTLDRISDKIVHQSKRCRKAFISLGPMGNDHCNDYQTIKIRDNRWVRYGYAESFWDCWFLFWRYRLADHKAITFMVRKLPNPISSKFLVIVVPLSNYLTNYELLFTGQGNKWSKCLCPPSPV